MSEVAASGRPTSMDELEERFGRWAVDRGDVRGLFIFGSRARHDRPDDGWGDLDVALVMEDPTPYRTDGTWLREIAPVLVTHLHSGPLSGAPVRQVVFAGPFEVDVIPFQAGDLARFTTLEEAADVFGRERRAVVDKDGELAALPRAAPPSPREMTTERFAWLYSDVLMQCVYSAKRLRRGELWLVKADVDGYIKDRLLEMLEADARLRSPGSDVWGGGRYLERWVNPAFAARLPGSFARYDAADVARALVATLALFRDTARSVAARIGAAYPDGADREVSLFLEDVLGQLLHEDAGASREARVSCRPTGTR